MKFTLFGIPVRIKPLFWLIALFIAPRGVSIIGGDHALVLAWLVVVLCSVVAHELGHALTARGFGAQVDITLHGLGGYTRWHTRSDLGPWRRVVVAAAGSLTGFALAGLVWLTGVADLFPLHLEVVGIALEWFVTVNLVWGVLNWLPIRPLDGGHMLSGVLQAAFGARGTVIANVIFPITTIIGGIWAWQRGLIIAVAFAGFLLMGEFQAWNARSTQSRPPSPEDEGPFTLFGDGAPAPADPTEPPPVVDSTPPDEEAPPEVG